MTWESLNQWLSVTIPIAYYLKFISAFVGGGYDEEWHAWKGKHVLWHQPNFGDIWEYDKVSKLKVIKLTITESIISS